MHTYARCGSCQGFRPRHLSRKPSPTSLRIDDEDDEGEDGAPDVIMMPVWSTIIIKQRAPFRAATTQDAAENGSHVTHTHTGAHLLSFIWELTVDALPWSDSKPKKNSRAFRTSRAGPACDECVRD